MFKISLVEGVKNIDKNKTMTYLTVILFAFLFFLQGYTYSYYAADAIMEDTYEHESRKEYHYYSIEPRGMPPIMAQRMYLENADIETAEFYAEIEASKNITYVGIREGSLYIKHFKGSPEVFASDRGDWDEKHLVKELRVTPNFHKVESYRIIKGRNFTDEDVKFDEDKPRPIILGYKYLGIYEVGDILEVEYPATSYTQWEINNKLEVIGILAEDTAVVEGDSFDVLDLDNYIVFPMYVIPIEEWGNYNEDIIEFAVNTDEGFCYNNIIFKFTDETLELGLQELQTAIDNYSNLGKVSHIYDESLATEALLSRFETAASFFAEITAVLMFFSVITVLISIVNRVSRNVKDYAIHIAVGATRNSAVAFILAEMSVILICSMVIGIFATKWMMHYINMPFYFWRFLGVYALTSVIILILSAVITLISMRKYDVCTLIK